MNINVRFVFYLSLLLSVLYMIVAATIRFSSLVPLLLLYLFLVYLSSKSLERSMLLIFIVLPFIGGVQEYLKLKAFSVTPLMILAAGSGFGWRNFRNDKNQMEIFLPKPVLIYFWGLVFSVGVGGLRSYFEYLKSGQWTIFINQMGWVVFFSLVSISGVLFYLLGRLINEGGYRRAYRFLMWSLTLSFAVVMLEYIGIKSPKPIEHALPIIEGRSDGMFIDSNAMGIFTAMLMPLWVVFFLQNKKRVFLIPWFTMLALIFLAGSRASYFIFIPGLLILAFYVKKELGARSLFKIFLTGSLLFTALVILDSNKTKKTRTSETANEIKVVLIETTGESLTETAGNKTKKLSHLTKDTILSQRGPLWESGWLTWKHYWFIGTGLGRYLFEMPKLIKEREVAINDNPGNMYLQIASEQGIIGVVLFLYMLAGFFKIFFSLDEKNFYSIAVVSSLIGLLISFVFGAHLLNAEVNLLFWSLLVFIPMGQKKLNYEYNQGN